MFSKVFTIAQIKSATHKPAVNDRVLVDRLKSPAYNGKEGKIVSLPSVGNDRYGVLIDGHRHEGPNALKKSNLAFAP